MVFPILVSFFTFNWFDWLLIHSSHAILSFPHESLTWLHSHVDDFPDCHVFSPIAVSPYWFNFIHVVLQIEEDLSSHKRGLTDRWFIPAGHAVQWFVTFFFVDYRFILSLQVILLIVVSSSSSWRWWFHRIKILSQMWFYFSRDIGFPNWGFSFSIYWKRRNHPHGKDVIKLACGEIIYDV